VVIAGVASRTRGCFVSEHGFSLDDLARQVRGEALALPGRAVADAARVLVESRAEIVLLCTPLDPLCAEPGLSLARHALSTGKSVVSVDKGPLALAFSSLHQLARQHRAALRFEGTVLDGLPILSLVEKVLPGLSVRGFSGLFNSTAGLALSALEQGRPFDDGLREAVEQGIAEADPSLDLQGFDAQMKVCILANALLGASISPEDVARQALSAPSRAEMEEHTRRGEVLRYVAGAEVLPEEKDALHLKPHEKPRKTPPPEENTAPRDPATTTPPKRAPAPLEAAPIRREVAPALVETAPRLEAYETPRQASPPEEKTTPRVAAYVRPEWVPRASPLGAVTGTSLAISLDTDAMGKITLVEHDPGLMQSAYALYSDLSLVLDFLAQRDTPR
jgi:homoserine dehydrogenase